MNFVHRFLGESRAQTSVSGVALGFAPDTLRAPTFFTGRIAKSLAFREAISALHHVVVSDMRFKPRDRTAYFEWLRANEPTLLAEAAAKDAALKDRIAALRAEISELDAARGKILNPYLKAQRAYFDYLY